MALSDLDRSLIDRCLLKQPQAWEEFVDRFAGLILFVVQNTCKHRSLILDPAMQEDLVQEVFVHILSENFVILRRFRGNCSLACYLTVIARRIVVKKLMQKFIQTRPFTVTSSAIDTIPGDEQPEAIIDNMDEVLYLVSHLSERDAKVIKMYHLEQKSYAEIADIMGIPENTVGPILYRAREMMRQKG